MTKGYKFHDPNAMYFVTFTVVQWIDLFTRNIYREIVIESLKYCQEHKGLVIHAYCIMSNHVHLIISRKEKEALSDIVRDFKKYTSRKIMRTIGRSTESRKGWLLWLFRSSGLKNSNNTHFQLWIQDSHPIQLSSETIAAQRLNYLHNNPVKAGIVYAPENYIFSSASAYSGYLDEALVDLDFLEF